MFATKSKAYAITFFYLILLLYFYSKKNTQVNKTVFILFFQGEQLKSKVKKICDG